MLPSAMPSWVSLRASWALVTLSVAVRIADSFPEPISRFRPI